MSTSSTATQVRQSGKTRSAPAPAKRAPVTKARKAPAAPRRLTAVQKAAALEKSVKNLNAMGCEGAIKLVHMAHDTAISLLDSQRAVWLAALGLLAEANATTGTKGAQAFEALVRGGASLEARAREAIETGTERLKGAMDDATFTLDQGIGSVGLKLDALVEQALDRLGFPKSDALNQLLDSMTDWLKALESRVRAMRV